MPRYTLDRQIHHIQDEVLLLGSMVEQAMINSIDALKRRDIQNAHQIYNDDHIVNEKRFAIENAILILIATQQPIAHDLRSLAAMLEVITELERMGDYAKGIAKVNMRLSSGNIVPPIRDLETMANLSVGMLHRALSAFINEDASTASMIPLEDDEVDHLYIKIYHALVDSMLADPKTIEDANLYMWVAHNLERMADRVSNICERTVFIASGELLELEPADDEDLE